MASSQSHAGVSEGESFTKSILNGTSLAWPGRLQNSVFCLQELHRVRREGVEGGEVGGRGGRGEALGLWKRLWYLQTNKESFTL